jgi:hypothetical protein
MIGVKQIEERLVRLEQLARGLSMEVNLWRGKVSPLLDAERRACLNGVPGHDRRAGRGSGRVRQGPPAGEGRGAGRRAEVGLNASDEGRAGVRC